MDDQSIWLWYMGSLCFRQPTTTRSYPLSADLVSYLPHPHEVVQHLKNLYATFGVWWLPKAHSELPLCFKYHYPSSSFLFFLGSSMQHCLGRLTTQTQTATQPLLHHPIVSDVDGAMKGRRGLTAIGTCPECDQFSLSEIVLCKGSNVPAHKGRWYQVVSLPLNKHNVERFD